MYTQVKSMTLDGIDGQVVTVEVDVHSGLPQFNIVGLPASSVREAKDRVRSAITNSGFSFPMQRITVNLAPADSRKDGSSMDLAIAIGILCATEQIPPLDSDLAIIGELSLDGSTRTIAGTIPLIIGAYEYGIKRIAVSVDALQCIELPEHPEQLILYPICSLKELARFLKREYAIQPFILQQEDVAQYESPFPDLAEVKDQPLAKRALEIAAAGSHNLLLVGPPGCGKSMLANRLGGILPRLTSPESLDVQKINSVANVYSTSTSRQLKLRPFRSPHHSISVAGLVGGGVPPRPGEITLAHHGVLFLDEIAEFPKHTLDQLRQPLETGTITLSRARHSYTLPSRFHLVAAMNPCPCGYHHSSLPCRCSLLQITRYQQRLSGPLLDRFQLYVWMQQPSVWNTEQQINRIEEPSSIIRARVEQAFQTQIRRNPDKLPNATTAKSSVELWEIENDALDLWQQTSIIRKLSARGHDQVLRVARTIADLASHHSIELTDIAESIQYTDQAQIPLV